MAESQSEHEGSIASHDLPAKPEHLFNAAKAAIQAGDLDELQSLLQQWRSSDSEPGPTPQDINYLVPRAAEGDGKPAILKYLLSQGGEIGTYTVGQTTSPAIFQIFIEHGWKVDNSILLSHISHPNLVSLFLSHGADPKILNARGFYPLDTAAATAPLESVKLLLSHSAPLTPGNRALNAAAQSDLPGRIEVMALLLEHGTDVNALAVDYPAPSEAQRSGRKGTPLHAAAKWGNEEVEV